MNETFMISAMSAGGLKRLIKQYESMGFKIKKKPHQDGGLWKVLLSLKGEEDDRD